MRLAWVMKGMRTGQARQTCNFFSFFSFRRQEDGLLFFFPFVISFVHFPLSFVWRFMGIRIRGGLLGSIISVWDRMWSCRKPPLPWHFGPHVVV